MMSAVFAVSLTPMPVFAEVAQDASVNRSQATAEASAPAVANTETATVSGEAMFTANGTADEAVAGMGMSEVSASTTDLSTTAGAPQIAQSGSTSASDAVNASTIAPENGFNESAATVPAAQTVVDNTTTLADGTYVPDAFAHRIAVAGSSDIGITCTQIIVRDGKTFAQVSFGDVALTNATVGGDGFTPMASTAGSVTFEVPVDLNAETVVTVGTDNVIQRGTYALTVTRAEPAVGNAAVGVDDATTVKTETGMVLSGAVADAVVTVKSPEAMQKEKALYSLDITPQAITPNVVAPDGDYAVSGVTTDSKMIVVTSCSISSVNGVMNARVKFSSSSIENLFLGTKEQAETVDLSDTITPDENGYFTIPVSSLDTPISVAVRSKSRNSDTRTWNSHTITIQSANLTDTGTDTVPTTIDVAPAGTYTASGVTTSSKMFRVVDCSLSSSGKQMTATIKLSGTGTDYLYMGSAASAPGDPEIAGTVVKGVKTTNSEGAECYQFTIPISTLDAPVSFASRGYSSKTNTYTWYDRTVTISSANLTPTGTTGGDTGGTTGGNTSGSTGGNDGGTTGNNNGNGESDAQNSDNAPVSGSAGNSTTLADGTYTPDSFSWGGGSGRLSGITCTHIRVSGGQAWATIVLQSGSYSAVSANGGVYYNLTPGSSVSTFEIPVALNQNNTISGLTTVMSAPHWVLYTVFVGLAAAGDGSAVGNGVGSTDALDQTAPTIAGLTYESETVFEHAKYVKLFDYDQGIKLIEVDVSTDTIRNEMDADDESQDTDDTSDAAIKAKLYQGNVIKYLVVPEGAEIPAGMDKQVVVIKQPADKVTVSSNAALKMIDKLHLMANMTTIGMAQDAITLDSAKQAVADKRATVAGTAEEPDYKSLVSRQSDLFIEDESLVPGTVKTDEAMDEKDQDAYKQEAKEKLARLKVIGTRCATLNIPLFIDRSAGEQDDVAKAEWVKVYGAIFGCADQAEAIYEAAKVAASKE